MILTKERMRVHVTQPYAGYIYKWDAGLVIIFPKLWSADAYNHPQQHSAQVPRDDGALKKAALRVDRK